jgi:hypothetical protein
VSGIRSKGTPGRKTAAGRWGGRLTNEVGVPTDGVLSLVPPWPVLSVLLRPADLSPVHRCPTLSANLRSREWLLL